jgi:GntR family transcriptional regulator
MPPAASSSMPLSAASTTAAQSSASAEPAAPDQAPAFSPLYQQIKALLTRSLQEGEWRPGEAIPSELELAARFRVSQGTVRKAIDELASDNLLMRRQGKGTFVATHSEEKVQYRFLRLQPDDAGVTVPLARRILECRRMRAPADVAKALELRGGDSAVQIRRTLSHGERPVVYDDIWLPGTLFKGLTQERLEDLRGPLYGLFETEFGVRMIRAEERIRAVAAEGATAEVLAVEPGAPLLSVERLSFTYGDKPVELRRGLYSTRTHHYRNELS